MELTKEQILYIEKSLIQNGIKHWDIRVEMLDHVVSDIEKKLTKESSKETFKKQIHNSFVALGWNGSFAKTNQIIQTNISKGYNSKHRKEIGVFLKSFKTLFLFLLGTFIFIFCSSFFKHKNFVIFSYIFFLFPALVFFYESIKLWKKKIGKSYHKGVCLNLFMISFFIFNIFMLAMKSEGKDFALPLDYQKPILFIILPIHILFFYTAYKVYKKSIFKIEKMKKELLS